jgi:hypothetical protein
VATRFEQSRRRASALASSFSGGAWSLRALARTAFLLCLTALAFGTAVASADTASVGAVGVNDIRSDGILLTNASWNGLGDLNLIQSASVQLYRARMQLNCVDPQHTGTFQFSVASPTCGGVSYDALVGALAARGITLLPVLINYAGARPQPPTADGAQGTPTITEFAAFAAAAVARYGPNGAYWATCGCTAHPVSAWEVWNEENNGWWWSDDASPTAYAQLFSATRAALRRVDAQARAVVGGLVWDPHGESSFIPPIQMLRALAATNANAFDAVAVHPYTDAQGETAAQLAAAVVSDLDRAAAAIRQTTGAAADGSPRQQVWITEMGWSDQDAAGATIAAGLQAFYAALTAGVRVRDNVGPVLWYMLRDNSTVATRDDNLGLRLTTANGADAGAKPVWSSFTTAAAEQGTLTLPAALPDSAALAPVVAATQPRTQKSTRRGVAHALRSLTRTTAAVHRLERALRLPASSGELVCRATKSPNRAAARTCGLRLHAW